MYTCRAVRDSLLMVLIVLPIEASQAGESMASYTTCAVYHRMMVGAMRSSANLQALSDSHMEQMNDYIALAKKASYDDYGEELGEELFNDEWADIQAEMTDRINRNYVNISRLKFRYQERCKAPQ